VCVFIALTTSPSDSVPRLPAVLLDKATQLTRPGNGDRGDEDRAVSRPGCAGRSYCRSANPSDRSVGTLREKGTFRTGQPGLGKRREVHGSSRNPDEIVTYDSLEGFGTSNQFLRTSRCSELQPRFTMGFLKKFFRGTMHESEAPAARHSSFEHLSEEELEAHLGVCRYGDFRLTDAVRPSYDLQVVPQQGYRHDVYQDEENKNRVPVLMAAASKEVLFELFMDLLEPLGGELDVVLETSHNRSGGGHQDLYREHIDAPVLKSTLWDFEDLLLNDGCTGIAVLNPSIPQEVQFDEHKLLIVYGEPLATFEEILQAHLTPLAADIKFITEAEHVHSSSDQFFQHFDQLKMRLGMDGLFD